ncbi:MAG: ABC transporter substrate-binding protein, partial [Planctomycetaceae bacterium]
MIERFRCLALFTAVGLAAGLAGCFSSDSGEEGRTTGSVEIEFPEGDPSVPAKEGGPGFQGEGWTTAKAGPLGDTSAVKGGTMLTSITTWPETLRPYGKGSNMVYNALWAGLVYESLCAISPQTLEMLPSLASHWTISDDKMTFTFRINPRAHWSDGQPVTADDVIATYDLIMDDTLLDPPNKVLLSKLERPVKKSKYIVEVNCKEKNWRNFITFSGMSILPAHQIGKLTGEEYREKYNFRFTVGSGPYTVYDEDVNNGEWLT